jgi:hypothetical protein
MFQARFRAKTEVFSFIAGAEVLLFHLHAADRIGHRFIRLVHRALLE